VSANKADSDCCEQGQDVDTAEALGVPRLPGGGTTVNVLVGKSVATRWRGRT
jgi:hypothetical protein